MHKSAKPLTKLQEWWIEKRHSDELDLVVKGLNQSFLWVVTTNVCQDSCGHCYEETVKPSSADAKYIDPNVVVKAVELFQPHKRKNFDFEHNHDVQLTGGDALSHPGIVEIVRGIKNIDEDITIHIRTSGYPLIGHKNDATIKELKGLLTNTGNIGGSDAISLPENQDTYHGLSVDLRLKLARKLRNIGFRGCYITPDSVLDIFGSSDKGWKPKAIGRATQLASSEVCEQSYGCCKVHKIGQDILRQDAVKIIEEGLPFYEHMGKYPMAPAREVCLSLDYGGNFRYCNYAKHSRLLHFDDICGMNKDEAIHKLALQYFRVKHLPDDMGAFFKKYDPKNEVPGPDNCARCVQIVNSLFSSN